jgi:hypothetical protein
MKMVKLLKKVMLNKSNELDVTIFQTPQFGEKKGYRQVYRLTLPAKNHEEAIQKVYRMFNVKDLMPEDYRARTMGTGDIILIDEGLGGQTYYKLNPGGWEKIHRVHLVFVNDKLSQGDHFKSEPLLE